MEVLNKSIVLEIKGNSYKLNQPNIGQVIEMEMLKAQVTNGQYGRMITNYNKLSVLSLDMVDMFSQLKVLCPEILSDLKVEYWIELDGFDAVDLFKAYQKKIKPWLAQFTEQLTEVWAETSDSIIDKDEPADKPKK